MGHFNFNWQKKVFVGSHYNSVCLQGKVGSLNSELTAACIPYGLKSKFPHNNLLMMIESGAKGSAINMAQIAAQVSLLSLFQVVESRPLV